MAAYTLLTLAGMWRYGVRRWLDNGEMFSVYTSVLATMSPWEHREVDGRRRLGLRPPIVGVTSLDERPAQVAFIGALVATVSFDGLSGSDFWARRDVTAAERLIDLGIEGFTAGIIVATIGLLVTLAVVIGAYQAAAWLSAHIGRFPDMGAAGSSFIHTLVPIALAYFVAHYFTLFVFSGQDIVRLISDPFGSGADLFGTADFRIDFQAVSPNAIWAVQVGAIVIGHVIGLALAHDRAVELSPTHRLAVASQGPMLVLMVALTVLGLWSLSEGMGADLSSGRGPWISAAEDHLVQGGPEGSSCRCGCLERSEVVGDRRLGDPNEPSIFNVGRSADHLLGGRFADHHVVRAGEGAQGQIRPKLVERCGRDASGIAEDGPTGVDGEDPADPRHLRVGCGGDREIRCEGATGRMAREDHDVSRRRQLA